jgi:hypothetical protein
VHPSTDVHISVFENSQRDIRAVTIGNPRDAPAEVALEIPAGACLVDLDTGQRWSEEDGLVQIDLGAWSVRLLTLAPT